MTASTAGDGHAKGTEFKGTNGHDDTHFAFAAHDWSIRHDGRFTAFYHHLRTVVQILHARLHRRPVPGSCESVALFSGPVHVLTMLFGTLWFSGCRRS